MTTRKSTAPAYDPEKRYALTLTRVVVIDGFTIRPGPTPAEPPIVSGELANAINAAEPGAISVAQEMAPERKMPEAPLQVHETADGVQFVINGPAVA